MKLIILNYLFNYIWFDLKLLQMKFLTTLFLFFILFTGNWETNFENAKKTAKEDHKLILLNFSGSDWCGPCILFRKSYLDTDVFSKMADENLVLVNADFPRKKKNKLSDDIIKQNNLLAEAYNKEGSFPFTLLLTAEGKVLKTWRGKPDVSVEDFTNEIKTICLKNK
jgi:thiol-disulfide isomerase/thioredoxin